MIQDARQVDRFPNVFVIVGAISFLLAGCTAGAPKYMQPADLTPKNAASIFGSIIKNPDRTTGDTRAYLVAIDDKLTLGGPRGFDKVVLADAGEHKIRFGIAIGNDGWGFEETVINLVAGETYTIRSVKAENRGRRGFDSVGWIEDSKGVRISPRIPVAMGRNQGPAFPPIIFIPR